MLRPHSEEANGWRSEQQEHTFSHVMPDFGKTPRLAGHTDGRRLLWLHGFAARLRPPNIVPTARERAEVATPRDAALH